MKRKFLGEENGRFILKEFLALDWEVKYKERSKEEGQQEKRKVGKGVIKERHHE